MLQGTQAPPCPMAISGRQEDTIYGRYCSGVGLCARPELQDLDDPLDVWLSLRDGNITGRCNCAFALAS